MVKERLRQRLPLGQIALFLAIALVCAAYVALNAVGADAVAPKNHYTVLMDDGGGITPHSPVAYRGYIVGEVNDVISLPGDAGVEITMSVLKRVKVPEGSEIVVAQDTPVALRHIDIRPSSSEGPYLADGATVGPQQTGKPPALEELLVNLMKLTDDIDIADITTIADELSIALAGTAPHLERMADNTFEIVDRFVELEPTARNLITNGMDFLEATGGDSGRLPRITKSLATITEQLAEVTPDAVELAGKVPPLTEQLVPFIQDNEQSLAVLMANLVTPAQIVSQRIPALEHGLVVIPQSFRELTSIADGDTANFEFVITQGPLCYYENERRTPQDTSPRDPDLGFHCNSELPVRGATNAPRPADSEPRPVITMSDPVTGRAEVPGGEPIRMGANGGQAAALGEDDSWQAIYLQGLDNVDLEKLLAEDEADDAAPEAEAPPRGAPVSDETTFPLAAVAGAGVLTMLVAMGLAGALWRRGKD